MTRTEDTERVGICETEGFKCIRKGPVPKQVQCIFAINTLKRIGIYTFEGGGKENLHFNYRNKFTPTLHFRWPNLWTVKWRMDR